MENALKSLEKEDYPTAIAQLNSFISSVEAQRGLNVTDEQAESLITAAEKIKLLIEQKMD
ncbi:MAG: hypothetical protein JSV49_00315 [Thermoplasmata archaeon]|nr:MAG: hypothetical protein JSV49_00315 [Thermoplasmata archaeon]